MNHTPGPWAVEHEDVKSDRPTVAKVGEYRVVRDGWSVRGYDLHAADIRDATLVAVAPDLAQLCHRLVDCVEFDVNGVQGKGGNGGLTSDDTIRAAGEMRILLSRIGREA